MMYARQTVTVSCTETEKLIDQMSRVTEVHKDHIELMRKAQIGEDSISESVKIAAMECTKRTSHMAGDPQSPIVAHITAVLQPYDEYGDIEIQRQTAYVKAVSPEWGEIYLLYGVDGLVRDSYTCELVLYDTPQQYATAITEALDNDPDKYCLDDLEYDPRRFRMGKRCTLMDVLESRGDLIDVR